MCDLVAHRLTVIARDASLFLAVNRDTQEAVRELFVIHELKSEPGNRAFNEFGNLRSACRHSSVFAKKVKKNGL